LQIVLPILWFSGASNQSAVLNSQVFIDATEYIPAIDANAKPVPALIKYGNGGEQHYAASLNDALDAEISALKQVN
jgi:hypothetical protein